MSHPTNYRPKQFDNQSIGSQSNGTPAIASIVPYAVEEPRTSLVPQKVYPPQEALFGNKRINVNALQFH